MTPERWKQVSQLYAAARGLAAKERMAFLTDACAHDAALLREVESLLDQATSPLQLEGLTAAVVTQALGDAPGPILTGRRFGDYLIGDRIDSGGMGDVYRARDTRLARDVAIKVLQPAFADDPDRLARFEREARLLAALDHPHIGSIYVSPFSNIRAGEKPVAPRDEWLASTGTAHAPRWRRDGREIFYWSSDRNKLIAVPVNTEGARITVGREEPLFDARPRLESYPWTFYDVSADGQRFLVNGVDTEGASSLGLIVNWPALVKN